MYFSLLPHSVQFSCSVVSDSLRPHGLQHAMHPCPSPTPGAYSNLCPLSQWCHPTISSSVGPFSSCLQSFPASGSFLMSQLFTSGGQSIGVSASASVLPTQSLCKIILRQMPKLIIATRCILLKLFIKSNEILTYKERGIRKLVAT